MTTIDLSKQFGFEQGKRADPRLMIQKK